MHAKQASMRYLFHSVCCTIAVVLMAFASGCALTERKLVTKEYETVAADPNRDTATARALHEKALKIIENSQNPALLKCGCLANAVCDVHKAEKLLHDALIADVRFGPAHNTLGLLYYYQRRLYLAAWEFEFAAGLMPGRAEPLNNLGLVYEEATQLSQAAEYYQMALEVAPGHPEALGNLARVELRQGNCQELVRPILKELLMNDSRPEWIGWAEDQLGVHHVSFDEISPEELDPTPAESIPTPAEPLPAPAEGVQSYLSDETTPPELELLPNAGP